MPEVDIKNLTKEFDGNMVLKGVSVTVQDGEFFTLLGPSGCGKSTTLNCVAGLERPDGGTIRVGSSTFVDVSSKQFMQPEERNLGMVFQSYALWPHMTIWKNLAVPLDLRKIARSRQTDMIEEALEMVGLTGMGGRFPHQLSGGQQQRVALARALVYAPSVLLLDEPLSNLDAKLREQARAWLKRVQRDLGITTLYVTHDQDEALAMSDRVAVMAHGEMLQVSAPEDVYERPATAEVAAFVGRCNFLLATYEGHDSRGHRVRLDASGAMIVAAHAYVDGLSPGELVTVAVRPEKLHFVGLDEAPHSSVSAVEAEVQTILYVGARYEYDLKLGHGSVIVESGTGHHGGHVTVAIPAAACSLYRGDARPAAIRDLEPMSARG